MASSEMFALMLADLMPRIRPEGIPISPPPLNFPSLYSTVIFAGLKSLLSNSNSPVMETPWLLWSRLKCDPFADAGYLKKDISRRSDSLSPCEHFKAGARDFDRPGKVELVSRKNLAEVYVVAIKNQVDLNLIEGANGW